MRSRIWLWTSVSTLALAAGASAAPVAPPVAPLPSWAGFYLGGNAGAIHQFGQSVVVAGLLEGPFLPPGTYNADGGTGVTAGGQVGYNWQYRALVYGVEADAEYTGGSKNWATFGAPGGHPFGSSGQQGIDWLATFRGRLGLAVENVMVYTTGGLAVGGVNDHFGASAGSSYGCGCDSEFSTKSTRAGWVIGGGVETMWWNNWTVRAEGLYVDLGERNVLSVTSSNFQAAFSNSAVIGRIGLNYKW